MMNHANILEDLKSEKFSQNEIAVRNNCSRTTVARIAKKYNVQIGRGRKVKNIWRFSSSSIELAYLIGVYITDGNLAFSHDTHIARQFSVNNSNQDIISYSTECLTKIKLHPSRTQTASPNKKVMLKVTVYSSDFAAWVEHQCAYKSQIPQFLFESPLSHKLAFLAGIIDGDGHVTKMGAIRIRGIDLWLSQLPILLQSIGIRTSGFKPTTHTCANTPYYIVSINRSDFRGLGGWCIVRDKMERILNATDKRGYRGQPQKHACSVCGDMKASKYHDMCRECYLKSDKFYQHLKDIAPTGSKAANAKRWGG